MLGINENVAKHGVLNRWTRGTSVSRDEGKERRERYKLQFEKRSEGGAKLSPKHCDYTRSPSNLF